MRREENDKRANQLHVTFKQALKGGALNPNTDSDDEEGSDSDDEEEASESGQDEAEPSSDSTAA